MSKLIRLSSQRQRAKFVRREIRTQGLTVCALSDLADLAPTTCYRFTQDITQYPRMDTIVKMFGALGFDGASLRRK